MAHNVDRNGSLFGTNLTADARDWYIYRPAASEEAVQVYTSDHVLKLIRQSGAAPPSPSLPIDDFNT